MGFDDIMFVYVSLLDFVLEKVDILMEIGGFISSLLIFINVMIGGGGQFIYEINRLLVRVVCKVGMLFVVGL